MARVIDPGACSERIGRWNLKSGVNKLHACLWNFKSSDYKNKQKRDAALVLIVQEVNIDGFGIQDVKNKIKNLRSTYSQEMKKINESKKSGAGLNNVYISNIKWLTEMEEVFSNDLNRKTHENTHLPSNKDADEQSSFLNISSQPTDNEVINTNTGTSTTSTSTTSNTGSTYRAKKRSRDIVKAISDLKTLHEEVNSVEETPYDMLGKSVASQLKTLSVENALLAQSRIQGILIEFGIKDHREKTAFHSSMSNHSSPRPSPAISNDPDESLSYQFDDHSRSYLSSPLEGPNNDILTLSMANVFK